MPEVKVAPTVAPAPSLAKFFAHKKDEPATMELHIKSLDTEIKIRELSNREVEKIITMQANNTPPFEVAAECVAVSLLHPNIQDQAVREQFESHFNSGNPMTGSDIVSHILRPFELLTVSEKVMELSGAMDEAVKEAKNS